MTYLLNCHICGCWVGKGGDTDVLDGEVGYPRCKECVRNKCSRGERYNKETQKFETMTYHKGKESQWRLH